MITNMYNVLKLVKIICKVPKNKPNSMLTKVDALGNLKLMTNVFKSQALEKSLEVGKMPKIVPLILWPICHTQKNKQSCLCGSPKRMKDP